MPCCRCSTVEHPATSRRRGRHSGQTAHSPQRASRPLGANTRVPNRLAGKTRKRRPGHPLGTRSAQGNCLACRFRSSLRPAARHRHGRRIGRPMRRTSPLRKSSMPRTTRATERHRCQVFYGRTPQPTHAPTASRVRPKQLWLLMLVASLHTAPRALMDEITNLVVAVSGQVNL